MSDTVVPDATDEHVKALIRKLGLDGQPVSSVPVRPAPSAVRADCFGNVERKVSVDGGEIVYGWCLWLFPDVWVEAEFHSVWRSPDGYLVDVTPKPDPHILFVPDPGRRYSGRTYNTVHQLILNAPLARDYVDLINLRIDFVESRRRPGQQNVESGHADALVYQEIAAAEGYLLKIVKQGGSRNRPCPCGSGSKFKHCHEKSLRALVDHVRTLLPST